jgi:hypothetical protein
VAWTEFLNPALVANSRRWQQALLALPQDHRGYRRAIERLHPEFVNRLAAAIAEARAAGMLLLEFSRHTGVDASDVSNFAQTPAGQRRNLNINRYAIAKRSVFISTC